MAVSPVVALIVVLAVVLIAAYHYKPELFKMKGKGGFRATIERPHAAPVVMNTPGGPVQHVTLHSGAQHTVGPAGAHRSEVAGVQHEKTAAGAHVVVLPNGVRHEIEAPRGAAPRPHTIRFDGATHRTDVAAKTHAVAFDNGVVHEASGAVRAPAGARDETVAGVRKITTADGSAHSIDKGVHTAVRPNGNRHRITDDHHEVETAAGARHVVHAEGHSVTFPVSHTAAMRAAASAQSDAAARHAKITNSGSVHVERVDGSHHLVAADGSHHAVSADGVRHVVTPEGTQHLIAHSTQRVVAADGVEHEIRVKHTDAAHSTAHPQHAAHPSHSSHPSHPSHSQHHSALPHPAAPVAHHVEIEKVQSHFSEGVHTVKSAAPEERLPSGERRIVAGATTHTIHDGVHVIATPTAKHTVTAAAHVIEGGAAVHTITPSAHHTMAAGAHHMSFPTGVVRTTTPEGVHIVHTPDGTKHSVHPPEAAAMRAGAKGAQHVVFPNGVTHRVKAVGNSGVEHHVEFKGVTHHIDAAGVHTVKVPGKPAFAPHRGALREQTHYVAGAQHIITPEHHVVLMPDGTHHKLSADGTHHAVTHDGSHHVVGADGIHQVITHAPHAAKHAAHAAHAAHVTHAIEPTGVHHTMVAGPKTSISHTVFVDGTSHVTHNEAHEAHAARAAAAHAAHAAAPHAAHAAGVHTAHTVTTADGVTHTAHKDTHVIHSPDGVVHTVKAGQHSFKVPAGARKEKSGDTERILTDHAVHTVTKGPGGTTHKIVTHNGTIHVIAPPKPSVRQPAAHQVEHTIQTPTMRHTLTMQTSHVAHSASHAAPSHVAIHGSARTEIAHSGAAHSVDAAGSRRVEPVGSTHTVAKTGGAEVTHAIVHGVKHKEEGGHATKIQPTHESHALPAHARKPAAHVGNAPVPFNLIAMDRHHGGMHHGEMHHGEAHHGEAHHGGMHGEAHHGEMHHGEAHHGEMHHGEAHAAHMIHGDMHAAHMIKHMAMAPQSKSVQAANYAAIQPGATWAPSAKSEMGVLAQMGAFPSYNDIDDFASFESHMDQWQ